MDKKFFRKSHKRWFLTKIIKAIQKYNLFEDEKKICVGLSGGKDSTTLLFLMDYLRSFSIFDFELYGIHINAFAKINSTKMKSFCESLNVEYLETDLNFRENRNNKSICYVCSKLKRGAISQTLGKYGINKIAYGHHATDVAVTMLMNMFQSKKLGSFSPKVGIPDSEIKIIRPLIYLSKATIEKIHSYFNLPEFDGSCEFEDDNYRFKYEQVLEDLKKSLNKRDAENYIVKSLENIDKTNIWEDLAVK